MQMPRVQNRTYDYHQGTASDTLSRRVLSETNKGLTNNSGTALQVQQGKVCLAVNEK